MFSNMMHSREIAKVIIASTSSLLIIALFVICTSCQRAQVVRAEDELREDTRFVQVQPFDMSQLPGAADGAGDKLSSTTTTTTTTSKPTCLGKVRHLDIEKRPKMREAKPTRFHIYTNGSWTDDIEFQVKAPSRGKRRLDLERDYQFNLKMLAGSGFDIKKQTVILIAGYLNTYLVPWQHLAAHEMTKIHRGQANIIVLVWPEVYTMYAQAMADTVMLSRQVTVFLHYLAQLSGTTLHDQAFLDRIHLVGHSLGAHIAGFVGKDLGGRVARITGLDPAGPDWEGLPRQQRLDRNDAQLVEVLHTNAGKMKPIKSGAIALVNSFSLMFTGKRVLEGGTRFGMQPQLGHIDYFANDGQRQKGCTDPVHFCDHARGYQIFVNLLKYELYLRDHLTSTASPAARRLWAFRSQDFESFRSGSHLAGACPHSIKPATHLNPTEVAKTFNKCALPLMDLTKPTRELIRELRDDFGVDFDPNSTVRRPNFHFGTKEHPHDLLDIVGRQFVLKIYLDKSKTSWNAHSRHCTLMARLKMDNGEQVSMKVRAINPDQSILSMPFAHPANTQADVDLQTLIGKLMREMAKSKAPLTGGPSEGSKRFLRKLFPRSVTLELDDQGSSRRHDVECKLAIKEIEVHPISLPGTQNVAVVTSGRLTGTKHRQYEFVSVRELTERLGGGGPPIANLGRSENTEVVIEPHMTLVDYDNYNL